MTEKNSNSSGQVYCPNCKEYEEIPRGKKKVPKHCSECGTPLTHIYPQTEIPNLDDISTAGQSDKQLLYLPDLNFPTQQLLLFRQSLARAKFPRCQKCGTIQLIPNPKTCRKPNCGQSFHIPSHQETSRDHLIEAHGNNGEEHISNSKRRTAHDTSLKTKTYAAALTSQTHSGKVSEKQEKVASTRASNEEKRWSGIRASRERSISITFHVIIAKADWDWDLDSRVKLHFGKEELGSWNDCGDFITIRDGEGGFSEMECTFEQFDVELLKFDRVLPYKYVVHTSKIGNEDNCYEYLHSFTTDCDRCLVISNAHLQKLIKGDRKYHHYDTVVYPKVSRSASQHSHESVVKAIFKTLVTAFSSQKRNEPVRNFKPLINFNLIVFSFQEFLKSLKIELFLAGQSTKLSLKEIFGRIEQLKNCLSNSSFHNHNQMFYYPQDKGKINEVLKCWLEAIIDELNPEVAGDRFFHLTITFFVLYSISKFYPYYQQLKKNFIVSILRIVSLEIGPLTSNCKEFVFIQQHLLTTERIPDRTAVVSCLENLLWRLSIWIDSVELLIIWLKALPILHFLNKISFPFKECENVITQWNVDEKVGMKNVMGKNTQSNLARIFKNYDNLKSTFQLDPHSLYTFVELCPIDELLNLCVDLPSCITLAKLIRITNNTKGLKANEVKQLALIIDSTVASFGTNKRKPNGNSLADALYTLKASQQLVYEFFTRLTEAAETTLTVLVSSIRCVLKASSFLITLSKEPDMPKAIIEIQSGFVFINEAIKEWIAQRGVIGGSIFGSSVNKNNWKGIKELMIWQKILTHDYNSMEPLIVEEWYQVVQNILTDRIGAVKTVPWMKLELFCLMEKESHTCQLHPVLEEVIMESILEAIDFVQTDQARSIEMLEEFQSKRVGTVFGKIFEMEYQPGSAILLPDLLHWHLWPKFLLVLTDEKKQDVKKGLSKHCFESCSDALRCVQKIFQELQNRTVTIKDLSVLAGKEQEIANLCISSLPSFRTMEGASDIVAADIYRTINNILKEYNYFTQLRQELLLLLRCLDSDRKGKEIKGLSLLRMELNENFDDHQICDVCETNNDRVIITCFKSGRSLYSMASQFTQMHGCDMFNKTWHEKLQTVLENSEEFTISDIETLVWKPTIDHFVTLIGSLISLELPLSDVHKYFMEYTFSMQVQRLFTSVRKCTGKYNDKLSQAKLEKALHRAVQYQQLCAYHDGTKVLLKLKDQLNLCTGDFSHLDTFSSHTMLEGKTLSYVDDSLIASGEFLDDITNDPNKIECLKKFLDCQALVNWLRTTAPNGVKDIHGFVHLAITTSAGGEDDLSQDRLSELQTVGSGFAPLIYDISKADGFQELKHKCEAIWKALRTKPELPELMVSCTKRLQWYQSVKDTQGDVETTSYGQMRNILKFGRFELGINSGHLIHTIQHLVHMKLRPKDKDLPKKTYTLDELRDLESKLVLICGDKADSRTEVDHFLNILHSATRIAELILKFHQVGNVEYSSINVEFTCALYDTSGENNILDKNVAKDLVESLQNYIKHLEKILENWEATVNNARIKYYNLNYFTTFQLHTLRKELGILLSLRNDQSCWKIQEEMLILLQSISSHVTEAAVVSALKEIREDSDLVAKIEVNLPLEIDIDPEAEAQIIDSISVIESDAADDISCTDDNATSLGISIEELTKDQRQIFDNCTTFFGFHEKLVLRAFKECGTDAEKETIEKWCVENEDIYSDDERTSSASEHQEDDLSEDSFSSESEQDNVFIPGPLFQTIISSTPKTKDMQLDTPIVKLQKVSRSLTTETHPIVQQLTEAGYTLDQSIEAVRLHKSLGAAMDYLDIKNTSDYSEDSSISDEEFFDKIYSENSEESLKDNDKLIFIEYTDEDAASSYLTLDQLGFFLNKINNYFQADLPKRKLDNLPWLHLGQPNLVVVSKEKVLKTVLRIYMEDSAVSPLPTFEEVLLCNERTTAEEVSLLWRRSIFDPESNRIFCLVHAERLTFQVCDESLKSLSRLSQGETGYRLVIVCSKEGEDKSHIISRLHQFKRQELSQIDDEQSKQYLLQNLKSLSFTERSCKLASAVDPQRSSVRIVQSSQSGMGKSLYVHRAAEKLEELGSTKDVLVTIPIHGPTVTPDSLLSFLSKYIARPKCTIYHLDVAPSVLPVVDTILFSLLVLKGLSNSQGNVWRCHDHQLYLIEVTVLESVARSGLQVTELLQLLPSVECISPQSILLKPFQDTLKISMDMQMFRSSVFQRAYQYLKKEDSEPASLDSFTFKEGSVEGDDKDFIKLVMSKCGISNPTWAEVYHFIKFLDVQLDSCEKSVFCMESLVRDVLSGMKRFVVKFMIRMSQDFSTPSLEGVFNRDQSNQMKPNQELWQYQITHRRKWEQCPHPYLFFNNDRETITFVGFKIKCTTNHGDLIDPIGNKVLAKSIISRDLYRGLKQNRVDFQEDYRRWSKLEKIKKIIRVLGIENIVSGKDDPDPSYILTADNLIKILAIQMRFRCDIPVVIMGETGCGKTRLIRYMCDLARLEEPSFQNMHILKIHGGVTEEKITAFMERTESAAKRNKQIAIQKKLNCPATVVFFDEANTTDSVDLIKEIMCDRMCKGKPVNKDLKFIAACNPYRQHSEGMIQKLESAGLGFYVRTTESQQTLGKIPLRHLVYRVLELPPSLRALVYDFGQLTTTTEHDYTSQVVKDHATRHRFITPEIAPTISNILAAAQKFMRIQEDECSFVSLRDVERAMIVFEFFVDNMRLFSQHINTKAKEAMGEEAVLLDDVTRAMILSLSVCYHARLGHRENFEEYISGCFKPPLKLPGGSEQFRNEIKWCQEVLLDNMVLGPNIAKNAALRENVFMMVICIELRIPLFLVGKPGSSKSLAKSIIQDSMHGIDSENQLLQQFKQVRLISYQCSQLSTSESVIEVFKTAEKIQSRRNHEKYVSVVVLDEVGLAEDSPNLPLKALHPLLEDGTEGAGKHDEQIIVQRDKRVAFIGISNWALDPAKMNRGVMVTRGTPGLEELITSANGICSNIPDDPIKRILQPYIQPLSEAYMQIVNQQNEKEFFGLRDFYSLIKMLYWMCSKSNGQPLTWFQLKHAVRRNFGGSPNVDTFAIFEKAIGVGLRNLTDYDNIPEKILDIVKPDCSSRGLIKASLNTKDATWHGENRYLLFLTENYAALSVLEHYLNVDDVSETGKILSKPFILFGSSFPKDKDYTQVCRNINRIKICMETGRAVILLNLEHLYESLYDVLNQYYMYSGGNRYVDLGLQTHRMKCRVHKNFKLILIAEKNTVYKTFPTPLINRLEKHFVLASSVLETWQLNVLQRIQQWVQIFSHTSYSTGSQHFREGHAFIGYQQDTAAAVVFQASNLLSKITRSEKVYFPFWYTCQDFIFEQCSINQLEEGSDNWKEAVFRMSQFLLLETASDESLARLTSSNLDKQDIEMLCKMYYSYQEHSSISAILKNLINESSSTGQQLFMQVTTHSQLLTHLEIEGLESEIDIQISHFDLHEFATELDFSSRISTKFAKEDTTNLIILQCDSGQDNYELIACARYRIYDVSVKASSMNQIQQTTGTTHVLLIVNLLSQNITSQFVGFQCDPWISVHIDDLRPSTVATIDPNRARHLTISELFIGEDYHSLIEGDTSEAHDNLLSAHEDNHAESGNNYCTYSCSSSTSSLGLHSFLFSEHSKEFSKDNSNITLNDSRSPCEIEHAISEEILAGDTDQKADKVSYDFELKMPQKINIAAQHWRLYNCIQAAVSAISDSSGLKSQVKLRILKLTKLIPRTIQVLGKNSFYKMLVSHIHSGLKRREKNYPNEDWVGIEARNPKKLQNGGTFRNVLSRRIDEVVIPIFSEIVASIDRNCNLDLIDENNLECSMSVLWLSIFQKLRFDTSASIQRNTVVDIKFKCKFPFSWIVFSTIEATITTVDTGMELEELILQVSDSVRHTDVGCCLILHFNQEISNQLYNVYLHDFVRTAYKSNYGQDVEEKEYQLVITSLNEVAQAMLIQDNLVFRIVSIHIAFKQYHSEFLWFNELVHHSPGIIRNISPGPKMDLHLLAATEVLNTTKPPLNDENAADKLQWWLNHVRLSQNVMNSILSISVEFHSETVNSLRANWQRIRALQMFVEHVILPHSDIDGLIIFARRLNLRLSDQSSPPDFLKKETLESVRKLLIAMDKNKKIKAQDSAKRILLRNSCRNFFMDIVSNLCFGQSSPPENKLISFVMDNVLPGSGTKKFSPYKDPDVDKNPTIRSFLLQLLLEHNPEQVKKSLDDYFMRCRLIADKTADPSLNQKFCLLCIQCFEDSLEKTNSAFDSPDERMQHLTQCLKAGQSGLVTYFQKQEELSLEYFEAIAMTRFALAEIADHLNRDVKFGHKVLNEDLLDIAMKLCTDPRINKLDTSQLTGPILFLLKILIRQYGFSSLMMVSKVHQWIIPEVCQFEDHHLIDVFVIYQSQYSQVRDSIKVAIFENSIEGLKSVQDSSQTVLLILSMFQQVGILYSKDLSENHPLLKARDKLDDFLLKNEFLNDELKRLGRLLLHNKQGGSLAQMTVSPKQSHEDQLLTFIVVHSASIIMSHQNSEILSPFINMIINPGVLFDAYLPTMKENLLQEFKAILTNSESSTADRSGVFYECKNGHPYLIGNCGRPWVKDNCNICGAIIGGTRHKLESGKKAAIDVDTTKRGYDLEDPSQRTTNYAGERDLPASSVCIVRAIMHSCFIWATCAKADNLEAIANVAKFRITAQELPEFFWRCLATDVQDLSNILKRGVDECAMILHLILRQILITNDTPNASLFNRLTTKQERKDWERSFNETYIEPVMKSLAVNLKKAMDIISKDDQQDHGKLFDLAYENVQGDEGVLDSHIWTIRTKITTEHLRTYITRKKESMKVLCTFLEVEQTLRATQYLPDIIKLQQYLFTRFNRRLDKSKASRQKIEEFLKDENKINPSYNLSGLITSLKKAWNIVGNSLCHYNPLPVQERFLPHTISDDTKMVYIIPTTVDEGRCTTALVHFLVNVHNDFIKKCRGILNSGSSQNDLWRAFKVQITQIRECHFIQHEQHLQSVILSHCHYSLTVGKGHDIKYDLPALEKHILNQFIYGKPTIKLDRLNIPNVAYCKDVYTAETFRVIREKVHPQTPIVPAIRQSIINELKTPERLKESLDVVDIVLGLLSSGGGKADVQLKKYLDVHKMKKRAFSTKAKDTECTLSNIISLWETLSVELARQLCVTGQEPFESVSANFTRDLSTHEKAELDKCLRKFDLDLLLGSLYEFIEVHVKNATNSEEDWKLVEALEVYRNMTEQDVLPNLQELPKGITVAKAVAVWKYIVYYHANKT